MSLRDFLRLAVEDDLELYSARFTARNAAGTLSTDPRKRSPKAISSSVISSVIALAKPENGGERTKADE
jgi:hypothetical protein